MQKTFGIVALVSAVLTLIGMIPGVIFIGLILLLVPGLILLAAPNVFIISIVLLLGGATFRPLGRPLSYLAALGALAAIIFALPALFNQPFRSELKALTAGDRDWSGFRNRVDTLVLLTPVDLWGKRPNCSDLCQRLLYNGSVNTILIGPPEPPFDSAQGLTRYRVERRPSCPAVTVPNTGLWPGEQSVGARFGNVISDRVKARIAAGECLIVEPGHISEANAIIADSRIKEGPYLFDMPWNIGANTIAARRLSVFERTKDGQMQEIFRQTAVKAEPIFTPLYIGPYDQCSGACYVRYGVGRGKFSQSEYELTKFIREKTGLKIDPIDDAPTMAVATLLRSGLADSTLPTDAPQLKLVEQYLKSVGEKGQASDDDLELVRRIILDRRITDLSNLAGAVSRLGPGAASLAEPLMERILTSDLPDTVRSPYATAVSALPPKAALRIMPQLQALSDDKQRRVGAAPALIRLSDAGPTSVPILLRLIDVGQSVIKSDSIILKERYSELALAALKGICRLGPEGAAAVPALLTMVQNTRSSSLGQLQQTAITVLVSMGKTDEVDALFADQEGLKKQAAWLIAQAKRSKVPTRDCYY